MKCLSRDVERLLCNPAIVAAIYQVVDAPQVIVVINGVTVRRVPRKEPV